MTRMSVGTIAQLRLAVTDPDRRRTGTGRTSRPVAPTSAGCGPGRSPARATAGSRSPTNTSPAPTEQPCGAPTSSSRTASGTPPCTGSTRSWRCRSSRTNATTRSARTPGAGANPTTAPTARTTADRRDIVRGALADTRGARGRARAVRDAARDGAEISEAVLAGLRPVHRGQLEFDLFADHNAASAVSTPST